MHELELFHDAGGEQRLCDRMLPSDIDVAAGSVVQVSYEVDDVAVDRTRVGPPRGPAASDVATYVSEPR